MNVGVLGPGLGPFRYTEGGHNTRIGLGLWLRFWIALVATSGELASVGEKMCLICRRARGQSS